LTEEAASLFPKDWFGIEFICIQDRPGNKETMLLLYLRRYIVGFEYSITKPFKNLTIRTPIRCNANNVRQSYQETKATTEVQKALRGSYQKQNQAAVKHSFGS